MLAIITSRTREVYTRRPRGPLVVNLASRQFPGLVAWYTAHQFTLDASNNWKNAINTQFTLTNTNSIPIDVDQEAGRVFKFTEASSHHFKLTSAILTAAPLTLACWWKAALDDAHLIDLHNSAGGTSTNCFQLFINVTGTVGARTGDGNSNQTALSTATYTGGALSHGAAVFIAANNRNVYVNGGGKVNNTGTDTPTGINRAAIGCRLNVDAFNNGLTGMIADARIYNRALTDADVYELYDPESRWELYYPIGRISYFFKSGAQVATLNQVTETDLAQVISWAPKNRLVAQTPETDLAQAITRRKTNTVGQAAETDLAQSVTSRKFLQVAQALETDFAQVITTVKARSVGQVIEVDLAQTIAEPTGQTIAVNQAFEIDLAQAISARKTLLLAQTLETDLAQAVTSRKLTAIGQALEIDLAQAITSRKLKAIAQALETDLAQAITSSKLAAIGQVTETDLAQAMAWAPKVRFVGQALEIDLAQAIAAAMGGAPQEFRKIITIDNIQRPDTIKG